MEKILYFQFLLILSTYAIVTDYSSFLPEPPVSKNFRPREEFYAPILKRIHPEITFYVTQQGGDEEPFTGEFLDHTEKGSYLCIICDKKLFHSNYKFDNKSGYAAFKVGTMNVVDLMQDDGPMEKRNHATCVNCGSHLGYKVDSKFEGLKVYQINSASLKFMKVQQIPDH